MTDISNPRTPVLSVDKVTKSFGGVMALRGVTLDLRAGEIMGLVGPNGAGKSVLQSCIGGAINPDSGQISIGGVLTTGWSPERLCHHGVSRTFQIPQPFLQMSVVETVLVGAMFGTGSRLSASKAWRRALDALEIVGFNGSADTPVAELNSVELRRIDLARAFACNPRLLMLDEVAAGLMSGDISEFVRIIQDAGKRNIAVIMIEHIIDSIMAACDRVVVMQQGRIVASGVPNEVAKIPEVIEAYFGSEVAHA